MVISGHKHFDLEFLATGAWQHVFVRTGDINGRVYKIPAAFGRILPFAPPLPSLRVEERYARVVRLFMLRVPDLVHRVVYRRLGNWLINHGPGGLGRIWTSTEGAFRFPRAMGQKLLTDYLARTRLEHFERMLNIIDYLEQVGLDDILVPCIRIREAEATLRLEQATVSYLGPILVQRRADFLFESDDAASPFGWKPVFFLEEHHWRTIAQSLHRLWAYGVSVRARRGMLGLRSWALVDNAVRLFDTSALSMDLRGIGRTLRKRNLDRVEQEVYQSVTDRHALKSAERFFQFMRREINSERLEEVWGVGLKAAPLGALQAANRRASRISASHF